VNTLGKKQKSVSIPLDRYEELEKLYEDIKDVCQQLEISSVSELLRILANLGKEKFLEIVEQVRISRTRKE